MIVSSGRDGAGNDRSECQAAATRTAAIFSSVSRRAAGGACVRRRGGGHGHDTCVREFTKKEVNVRN